MGFHCYAMVKRTAATHYCVTPSQLSIFCLFVASGSDVLLSGERRTEFKFSSINLCPQKHCYTNLYCQRRGRVLTKSKLLSVGCLSTFWWKVLSGKLDKYSDLFRALNCNRSSLFFWKVTKRRPAVTEVLGQPIDPKFNGFPETSATNYQSRLRNIPEERRSHLHRSGSLISTTKLYLTVISNHFY